jgi:hypothetical protein
MFLPCQKCKVTIKLKFYYSNLKNATETVKIAVDSCYVLQQLLTPLPSIDFGEIRGLLHSILNTEFGLNSGCSINTGYVLLFINDLMLTLFLTLTKQ